MADEDIKYTTEADDIDMLVNLLNQIRDGADCEDVSVQIPCDHEHCKHWTEVGVDGLIELLEKKFENARRLQIPSGYVTEN